MNDCKTSCSACLVHLAQALDDCCCQESCHATGSKEAQCCSDCRAAILEAIRKCTECCSTCCAENVQRVKGT